MPQIVQIVKVVSLKGQAYLQKMYKISSLNINDT